MHHGDLNIAGVCSLWDSATKGRALQGHHVDCSRCACILVTYHNSWLPVPIIICRLVPPVVKLHARTGQHQHQYTPGNPCKTKLTLDNHVDM